MEGCGRAATRIQIPDADGASVRTSIRASRTMGGRVPLAVRAVSARAGCCARTDHQGRQEPGSASELDLAMNEGRPMCYVHHAMIYMLKIAWPIVLFCGFCVPIPAAADEAGVQTADRERP